MIPLHSKSGSHQAFCQVVMAAIGKQLIHPDLVTESHHCFCPLGRPWNWLSFFLNHPSKEITQRLLDLLVGSDQNASTITMIIALKPALHIQVILRDVLLLIVSWKKVSGVIHTLVSVAGEATLSYTRTRSAFLWFISRNQNQIGV